jgi:RNA polymerase sigma factor (sigma-70 family)
MTVTIPVFPTRTRSMIDSAHLTDKNFGLAEAEFETLLLQLEHGDEALFERVFVRQYWKMVRRLKASHHTEQADAEDAVMDGLLQFRKILLARKVTWGNLEAYLSRIVVTGFQKKQQRKREITVESFAENVAADEDSPRFSNEELAAFKKAWDSLCDKCSTVLRSFYYDELPHQRIADLLGKRQDAVKQDKHRCIEKLRKIFFQSL